MSRLLGAGVRQLQACLHSLQLRCCQTAKLPQHRPMGAPGRWSCASVMRSLRTRKKLLAFLLLMPLLLLLVLLSLGDDCGEGGRSCHRRQGPFITKYAQRPWRDVKVKRILRWTGFFDDASWEDSDDRFFAMCKVKDCTMTNDKSLLEESDAVLFHVGAMWNFWRGITMPANKPAHQVWILSNVEPPPRVPLNAATLAGVFNWTSWYRLDSDVPVTYGGFRDVHPAEQAKAAEPRNFFLEKPRLAAWMSSNCFDLNRRQKLVHELKKHMPLDLYGKCGTRRCPETICRDTISNYKFFLTFENCNCKDYITEKFWEALRRQQVPIVYGAAGKSNYERVAPPNSFIHVDDFPDMAALAQHLLQLSRDPQAYNRLLQWTQRYEVYGEMDARRKVWCDLCEALHDKSRPAQVYHDLEGWMQDDLNTCPQWTIRNQISRWKDGIKFKLGWK